MRDKVIIYESQHLQSCATKWVVFSSKSLSSAYAGETIEHMLLECEYARAVFLNLKNRRTEEEWGNGFREVKNIWEH